MDSPIKKIQKLDKVEKVHNVPTLNNSKLFEMFFNRILSKSYLPRTRAIVDVAARGTEGEHITYCTSWIQNKLIHLFYF